ncbi:MAG: hypothetical protein ACRD96_22925, partial [Bryobacteraceae bacterium]
MTPQGRTVHVDPGDTIQWLSNDERFGIHFQDNASPFTSGNYTASAAKNTTGQKTALETVRAHAVTTRYEYFVASAKTSGPKHVVTD